MLSEPSVIQNDRTTLYGFLSFCIPAALGLLSTYQHFPFHTTAITVPLRPYHTSHKHHSAARNKAHLFFATDRSLYLTSFGRRAVLYNENLWWFNTELKPYFSDFNFMQISPQAIFQTFSVIFLPVLLVPFILPMDSQRNNEALSYHSHQITMAERHCHWDGWSARRYQHALNNSSELLHL